MEEKLQEYKGIHPGRVVRRELQKRGLKQVHVARSVDEFPQTFNQILSAKRRMNVPLALQLEKVLGWEEGTLAFLQTHYDIARVKRQQSQRPNLTMFRESLFWDADLNRIDWRNQAKAVITRVMERGNTQEKEEILKFYGPEVIEKTVSG